MVFKHFCIIVFWTKVASALEGLIFPQFFIAKGIFAILLDIKCPDVMIVIKSYVASQSSIEILYKFIKHLK